LYERDAKGSGNGQMIDLSIYEPMFSACGYQTTLFDQIGLVQQRLGNRSAANAPRGVYRTKDDKWVALSAAAPSVTRRVLLLTGGPEAADDPRFQTADGRRKHNDELDKLVGDWIAQRTLEDVLRAFDDAEAAAAAVFNIEQILHDAHYAARGDIVTVNDPELGQVRMQNAFPFLSRTPGCVRYAGPALGAHNEDVYGKELGIDQETLARLRRDGVI
jgi:formyl-CoA transferase